MSFKYRVLNKGNMVAALEEELAELEAEHYLFTIRGEDDLRELEAKIEGLRSELDTLTKETTNE